MLTVNVVVLAGTISAEPVQRRLPSGDEVTELRVSVPDGTEPAEDSGGGDGPTPGELVDDPTAVEPTD